MAPLVVLVSVTAVLWLAGRLGVPHLDRWPLPLRGGLAAMFLLTASAHFAAGRADLIRMVPPWLPAPALLVTGTGVLEVLGAIGLLVPQTARLAAAGLTILLVALFPANVHAALSGLQLHGRPVTPLPLRTILQAVFIAATLLAARRPA